MALHFDVSSYEEMLYLVATFDRAFPEAFLRHQAVELEVLGVASVASARGMAALVLHRERHYGWTVNNLPALRNLAHLSELVAFIDDHLRTIAERLEEGGRLRFPEREGLFGPLEAMAHAVERAAEDCVQMVRDPATTLARTIAYFAKSACRRLSRFPRRRIVNRVAAARERITEIMNLAPPMV